VGEGCDSPERVRLGRGGDVKGGARDWRVPDRREARRCLTGGEALYYKSKIWSTLVQNAGYADRQCA